jgi:hypothetical protein
MFQSISAPDRTKPEKQVFYAVVLDEKAMNDAYNLVGRLLAYSHSAWHANEQRRRWKREFPAVKTRCVLLRRGDLPIRTWIDPRLHMVPQDARNMFGEY